MALPSQGRATDGAAFRLLSERLFTNQTNKYKFPVTRRDASR